MTTTRPPLIATEWRVVGSTPCYLQLTGPGAVLYVVDTVAPASLDVPCHVLSHDEDPKRDVRIAGQTVYARTLNDVSASLIVSPIDGAGGGSGGDASAAKQQTIIDSLGTDGASPPAIAGTGVRGWLRAIYDSLGTLLGYERPFQGVIPLTVGTAATAGRAVRIVASAGGNVSLTYADATTDTIPVNPGLTVWPGAVTTVNASGTTATASYANLK